MRVVMMGTGTFAEPTLEALLARRGLVAGVVTQPDRDIGAKRGSTRQVGKGIKSIADAAGVPVIQPASINTPEGVAALREFRPDLFVVAAYGQILKPEVLAAAPLGGINVHASLLPKYRGAAPVAWAIWSGETRTGVTIIRMSAGLDAGDMLAQEAIDILPDETAGELEARLAPLGAQSAMQVIDRLAEGPFTGMKQEATQVTRAPKLKKEMGQIDWSQSADRVRNQIRAMQPWPTAYTFLHGEGGTATRVIVTRARLTHVLKTRPTDPGHLWSSVEPGRHGPVLMVETGSQDFDLCVLELQPAGKRAMSTAEFLRGRPLQPGDRFGADTGS